MAQQPFGSNLGPGNQWLSLPKPPAKSSTTPFKVHLPTVKSPTVKKLSTRSTLPRATTQGAGSSSSSPTIFGGSSKGKIFGGSSSSPKSFRASYTPPAPTVTQEQAIWLAHEKQAQQSQHHGGLISGLLGAAANNPVGHAVGDVLGVLQRPVNAAAAWNKDTAGPHLSGVFSLSQNLHGLSDAWKELQGKPTINNGKGQPMTHATFWDTFNVKGTRGYDLAHSHDKWARYLAHGIAATQDVSLDPLNLVGGAGVWSKAGRGFEIIKGLQTLDKTAAGGADLAKYADYANQAKHLGVANDQADKLLEHIQMMSNKGITANAAIDPIKAEEHLTDISKLTMLSRTLQAEAKSNMSRYLGLRLGGQHSNIIIRTPIKTGRTLAERIAAHESGNVLSRGFTNVAKSFKPGYLDPVGHSLAITAKHAAERMTVNTWKAAWHNLSRHFKVLKTHDQEDALAAVANVPKMVNEHTRQIDNSMLTHHLEQAGFEGDKLQKAKAFVRAWHDTMDHIRESGVRAGVYHHVHAKMDEIHVPHQLRSNGEVKEFISKGGPTTLSGSEKFGQKVTYAQLLGAARSGKGFAGRDIVTDPAQILRNKIESASRENTHAMVRDVIRKVWGKPEKVISEKARAKVARQIHGLEKQRAVLHAEREASHNTRANTIMLAGKERKRGYEIYTNRQAVSHAVSRRIESAYKKDLKAAAARYKPGGNAYTRAVKDAQDARKAAYDTALQRAQRVPKSHAHFVENEYRDAVAQAHLAHSRNLDRTAQQLDKVEQQINHLTDNLPKLVMKKQDASAFRGMQRMDNLKEPIFSPSGKRIGWVHHYVPHEIHKEVGNVERFLIDPGVQQSVAKAITKSMAMWKFGVTVMNPGYRVRNTISDMWNMFVSGVPAAAIPVYQSKALKFQVAVKEAAGKLARREPLTQQETKTLETATMMHDHGILSGQFLGDVAHLVRRQQGGRLRPLKAYASGVTAFNVEAENNTRIAHMLYLLDHKYSVAGAAERVRMAHFDYEDLTPLEKNTKNLLIPFYTWTRKNVPYQLKQLGEQPARFNHAIMAMQGSEGISGKSPHDVIGHALDFAPTAFRFGPGYINEQLGLNDLINIGNMSGNNTLAQSLNPFLKSAIELTTGHQIGTGDAISGPDAAHQMTPAPGILSQLLQPLGLGGTTARMGPDGKMIHGPGIDNHLAYLLQQLPLSGLALGANPIDEKNKTTGLPGIANNARLLSYLTGIGYIKPNAAKEQAIASIDNSNAEKAYFKQLRDEGILAEPKHKQSHSYYQQLQNKYLKAAYTRGR